MNQGKYVTPRKAAKQLGVCLATLRRWEAERKIGAIRTPGGQRRLTHSGGFVIIDYKIV